MPPTRSRAWPIAVTIIAITVILAGGLLYVFNTLTRVPAAVAAGGREVLRDLSGLAAAFSQGTVTTSFISYATEVAGVQRLQFANLEQMEVFERTDQVSVLWGTLQLPDLVVRATAPVEYTYYLDLGKRWEFELEGDRVRVLTPKIEWNRPAVDVSRLEYEVRESSVLRDSEEALERLRSGLTQMSSQRARANVPLVREIGRRQVELFVATWLGRVFSDGEEYVVEVVFPDEIGRTPAISPPTRERE